jgi:hypothetical protein
VYVGFFAIAYVVARGVGAREFSLPPLGAPFAPSELAEWDAARGLVDRVVEVVLVGVVIVEERQLLFPPGVEGVVVFGGRPGRIFSGPGRASLRWIASIRSARRCAASAFASFCCTSCSC